MEEKPESLSVERPERRGQPRYGVDDSATFLLLNNGCNVSCNILELSLGGCRLRLAREIRVALPARVEVAFKVRSIAFRLSGVTQWSDGKQTVGIRFGEMSSRRREELADLLSEIEADVAAKEAKAAAEKLAAEKAEADKLAARRLSAEKQAAEREERERLSQEKLNREKLNQLKPSLIEPSHANFAAPRFVQERAELQKAAGAPVVEEKQERHPGPEPVTSPTKRERRAQMRHSVDTNATIFLVDVASRERGRILDVSLGGCKIHSEERFPVGIYRRVEVEFVLDGLPFRLGGVTQSLHDKRTVGIRFLDMSERKREQLRQVIEELDQKRGDPEEDEAQPQAEIRTSR